MALGYMKMLISKMIRFAGYELVAIKPQTQFEEPKTPEFLEAKAFFTKALEKGDIKLHFGCGPRILKGWVNIDLVYAHYEPYLQYYTDRFYPLELRGGPEDFIPFDVTKQPLPLPDNSVDLVFHEDFLEHLGQKDQFLFLAETYRVLKPGGIHHINTPDIIESMKINSDLKKGFSGVHVEEWDKHGHINVLSQKTLEEMALSTGYSQIHFVERDQSQAKGLPLEYRPDPKSRSKNGNIFVDLIK